MALLVGRHINKIDKKGRVSVPKLFRDAFGGQAFAGLYAYPLFKSPAIEACGEDFMVRLSESLDDLDMFSDEQDDLASVILENAHPLAFDPEGRVVLPPELLEHANISSQALFVGRGARMQIWEPDAYAKHSQNAFKRARSRGATLRLRPHETPTDTEG
ncbi:MAG: division/cell wall cluster transcriptional repressor MraZ [Rhodospirillales bacterium]|nr:division/cell wall cluster transcriptional repressor MraZ [Rhodospirillales bacterium]